MAAYRARSTISGVTSRGRRRDLCSRWQQSCGRAAGEAAGAGRACGRAGAGRGARVDDRQAGAWRLQERSRRRHPDGTAAAAATAETHLVGLPRATGAGLVVAQRLRGARGRGGLLLRLGLGPKAAKPGARRRQRLGRHPARGPPRRRGGRGAERRGPRRGGRRGAAGGAPSSRGGGRAGGGAAAVGQHPRAAAASAAVCCRCGRGGGRMGACGGPARRAAGPSAGGGPARRQRRAFRRAPGGERGASERGAGRRRVEGGLARCQSQWAGPGRGAGLIGEGGRLGATGATRRARSAGVEASPGPGKASKHFATNPRTLHAPKPAAPRHPPFPTRTPAASRPSPAPRRCQRHRQSLGTPRAAPGSASAAPARPEPLPTRPWGPSRAACTTKRSSRWRTSRAPATTMVRPPGGGARAHLRHVGARSRARAPPRRPAGRRAPPRAG
jgi:hypothetical protein